VYFDESFGGGCRGVHDCVPPSTVFLYKGLARVYCVSDLVLKSFRGVCGYCVEAVVP
jgi:hypothetical protein